MIAVGLDVHKDSVFCGVDNGEKQFEVKSFSTLTCDLRLLGEYLLSIHADKVAMESTSIYWIPIWNILEEMGFDLILVNPFMIKQMPGRKSDVKDAQWIATLLQKNLLRASLVPNKISRELRTYSRRYDKLQRKMTPVLQEMERTLEMCSIRITSYVSNISAKSIQKVINTIIDGTDDVDTLEELIHKRIRNKHKENITKSLEGHITEHHRFILSQLRDEYSLLEQQSKECVAKMDEIGQREYSKEIELLDTIPGVGKFVILYFLAETGADMSKFENSSKFVGWLGLRPRNDESAGKYKSTAITKGNKFLRTILVQAGWGAVKVIDGYFMGKFTRMCMRKSKKKALIAVARKLAVLCYSVLSQGKPFDPSLLPSFDPKKIQKQIEYHQSQVDKLSKRT